MAYQFLQTMREGQVERVTLNRPEVRNAFNEEVIAEFTTWARSTARDPDVRVCVIAGAGRAFCAGADVKWMARMVEYTEDENRRDARAMAEMFEALNTLPQALIGRVHGAALGGGTGLAAVCDLVVAAADASFGFTEVKLGILPAVIAPYCVAKIGVSAARELMLTGVRFSAAEAQRIGLVHQIVTDADLDATVDAFAREILTSAPGAIAAVKKLIAEVAGELPADVMTLTSRTIAVQRVSAEGQEGLRAFLEKRTPEWAR